MPRAAPTADFRYARLRAGHRQAGRVFVIFAPILALLAIAVVLLLWAWVDAPVRAERVMAAEIAAGIAGLLAMLQLVRQIRQRQAATIGRRSAEMKFTEVVESAMDPIIVVDDSQRVEVFNAAAEAVFRWPRAAVIGQPLDMLLPERLRAEYRDRIARFGETGVTSLRMGEQRVSTALRADGAEFPIEASISRHVDVEGQLYTVILRDISERVVAESLLSRSEARLRGILDSAMDAIIAIDEKQHIVLFNAAAETMFRCARDEAVGAPLSWLIPARHRGAHGEHVRDFGEAGTESRRMSGARIVTGLRRDGEEFPIDASISQLRDGNAKYFTVILRDITARMRTEEDLQRSKDELQELASTAQVAREQEKSRVARELHDELGQSLTMLQMDVAWFKAKLPPGQMDFAARLDRMEKLLKTTVAATRRIAADLRPLMLDDLGLVPAVEWLVENFTQRTGVPCTLEIEDRELRLESMHSNAVFRIVQEALTNVAKHAGASRAEVAIARAGDDLLVRVRDDGAGFAAQDPRKPNSFGLVGLRERAAMLKGVATIMTAIGEGTMIEVRLPVPRQGANP